MTIVNLANEIFRKLKELGIIDENGKVLYQYMKFEVPGSKLMMAFHVDWVWFDRISLAHFAEGNGDMMADPLQFVKIDAERKEAFAYSFRNDFVGYNSDGRIGEDEYNPALVMEHSMFLTNWLDNVRNHGYELAKTMPLEVGERKEVEAAIEKGKKLMQDLADGKITMEDVIKRLEGEGKDKE